MNTSTSNSGSSLKAKALCLAIATALSGLASAAHADTLQDLKAQIDALQKKVGELEQKQRETDKKQAAATPANAVTGGVTKGSFRLPGSNTSVTLGGYVKLDAIYSSRSAGVGTGETRRSLRAPFPSARVLATMNGIKSKCMPDNLGCSRKPVHQLGGAT